MATTYSVTDYLLDRANIHDTLTQMPWYYDVRSEEGLANEVYAPNVDTKILGGEPYKMTGKEWASNVVVICREFDSSQHIYGNLIIELPQPGNVARPSKAKVLTQAQGNMVKKDARGGPLMQNGGRAVFDLVRVPEFEAEGRNPWRIATQDIDLAWENGNMAVFKSAN